MESVMGDDFYFLRFEHRPLTPEQWDLLTRNAVRRAHEERVRMLRGVFVAVGAALRRAVMAVAVAASGHWRAYTGWLARRAAIKELGGLDDRVLKDIGLHRSEIESAVYGPDPTRLAEAKAAPVLFCKRAARKPPVADTTGHAAAA